MMDSPPPSLPLTITSYQSIPGAEMMFDEKHEKDVHVLKQVVCDAVERGFVKLYLFAAVMRSDWKLQQSKLSTLILIISGHFLLVDSDDQDNDDDDGSLSLSVWEVYSDSVILDWFITLQNKHRFTTYCSRVPEDIISSIKSTRISINECSGNKDFFVHFL